MVFLGLFFSNLVSDITAIIFYYLLAINNAMCYNVIKETFTRSNIMKELNTFNDLKGKLSDSDIDQIVALLGSRCRSKTLTRLRSMLTYGTSRIPVYGILERLIKEDGEWRYFAGQSYPDEIRTIREIIIN